MKSLYVLTRSVYNGRMLIRQETSTYTTAELRDIARQHLENQSNTLPDEFTVMYTEFVTEVCERALEVSILHNRK